MDMIKEISMIDDLQAKINAFRPFNEDLLALWQERLRVDWTYNSNAIEGNTLTYGETAFFLREGLTSEGRPLKDYVEAKNHAEAIDYLQEIVQSNRMLTESFIKELHGLLLRDIHHTIAISRRPSGYGRQEGADGKLIHKPLNAGKYKLQPNHVLTLSGTIHTYIDPIHVLDEMQGLLRWLEESNTLHPVERAILFHYRFVSIHPFDDGNGRMARLLMNMLLMQAGYPPCVVRHSKRREYLQSLEDVDSKGSTNTFVRMIASELIHTEEIMLDVLQGKPLPPMPGEKLHRDARKELILKTIGDDTLSMGQLADRLPRIKRPTLKHDVSGLVRAGKLKKNGKGKGVIYTIH